MRLPYKPRFLNCWWAKFFGYFWLPCPICKKMFGGHEVSVALWISSSEGKSVCPKCADAVRVINFFEIFRVGRQIIVKEKTDA